MRAGCFHFALLISICVGFPASEACADEGFWLFNNPPRELLKERYDFDLMDAWLDHVQQAAVAFNSGGSGAFISADGLIITAYHVAADPVSYIRIGGKSIGSEGFLARSRAHEVRFPGLNAHVLESVEDVTRRIHEAVKPGMTPVQAYRAKLTAIKTLENKTQGLKRLSEVVVLYEGAEYHLYRYKRYTDLRLVFLPEADIGLAFDVCFLRAYEDDKPAQTPAFLRPTRKGARQGDLVFMVGNPEKTERRCTIAELEQLSRTYGNDYRRAIRQVKLLDEYRALDPKNIEETELLYQGSKIQIAQLGSMLAYLDHNSEVMQRRRSAEETLRKAIAKNPAAHAACRGAWDRITELNKRYADLYERDYRLFVDALAFGRDLFDCARTILRVCEEAGKPTAERLYGYDDDSIQFVRRTLLEPIPFNLECQKLELADSLNLLVEEKGAEEETVRKVLAGKSPRERAAELVQKTKLNDPKARIALLDGGRKAIEKSNDPMIVLARLVDPLARKLEKEVEEEITTAVTGEKLRISTAIQTLRGADAYPEAGGTLRLTFGKLNGRRRDDRSNGIPRTIADVYTFAERNGVDEWIRIPSSWKANKDKLRLRTELAISCSCDVNHGASGGPVINRSGDLLGVAYRIPDDALWLKFEYKEKFARTEALSTTAIIEVLNKVYNASELVKELTSKEKG